MNCFRGDNKWKIIGVICLLWLFAACNKTAEITGHISQNPQKYAMLYKMLPYELEFMDTILLVKGKFSYLLHPDEMTIYVLRFNDTCFASFAMKEGDKIHIEAEYPDMNRSMDIQGNEETRLMLQTRRQLFLLDDRVKILSEQFIQNSGSLSPDSLNQYLMLQYDTLYHQHKLWLKEFILSHPQYLASLTAYYQTLGRNAFFSWSEDRYLLDTLYQYLSQTYPNSMYVCDLAEKLGNDD